MTRFVSIVFFSCILLFSASTLAADSTVKSYEEIRALRLSGKIKQAKEEALKYLQKYPKDGDVMLTLGLIAWQEKNFESARQWANKVLQTTPKYTDARLLLIRTELATKQYQIALKQIKQGFKYDPKNKELAKLKLQVLDALQPKLPEPPKITYSSVVLKYLEKNKLATARMLAEENLRKNPDDDSYFLLGRVYAKEENYCGAKEVFTQLLCSDPKNTDVRLALVDLETANCQGKPLLLINHGFCLKPDPKLLLKKSELYSEVRQFHQSAKYAKQALCIDPKSEQARAKIKELCEINPKYLIGLNEIGFVTQEDWVTDLKQWWNYSNFYLGHHGRYGRIAGLVNYANRRHIQGIQEELFVSPVFGKYITADFDVAYAKELNLFPRYYIAEEIFITVFDYFDFSLGEKYVNIDGPYYNLYTGSLSKEKNKFWISFRPYHFVPNGFESSTLYTLTAKKYFCNYDSFVAVTYGTGHSPDLNDLVTGIFIVIKNDFVVFNIQIPLCNHLIALNIGGDYQHQVFPSGTVREIMGGILGLQWRF